MALPLTACLYGLLFLVLKLKEQPWPVVILLTVATAIFATHGIKLLAPLYFIPVVIGLWVSQLINNREKKLGTTILVGILLCIGAAALVFSTYYWQFAVNSLPPVSRNLLLNPLVYSSGFLVISGLLCALHALLTQPKPFLGSTYRSSLLALTIIGPVLLSSLPYNPLRYWIPLLPAYLLLVLEWIYLRNWLAPVPKKVPWSTAAACIAILTCVVFYLGQVINKLVLEVLPVPIGTEPGLSDNALYSWFGPLAAFGALGLWKIRHSVFRGKAILPLITVLLIGALSRDLYMEGRFLLSPSYESREISRAITQLVPKGASIMGDWAPWFALGTDLKALNVYQSPNWRIDLLRPEYLLFSDTPKGYRMVNIVNTTEGIELAPPIYQSTYLGRPVTLFPVRYGQDTPEKLHTRRSVAF